MMMFVFKDLKPFEFPLFFLRGSYMYEQSFFSAPVSERTSYMYEGYYRAKQRLWNG